MKRSREEILAQILNTCEMIVVIAQQLVQPLVADQREGLLQRRLVRSLAFAGQEPLGLAEGLQEPVWGGRPFVARADTDRAADLSGPRPP